MKEHRRTLHRKRRLLLPSTKWKTGLGVFRKLCFPQWHCLQLKKKKQSAKSVECVRRNQGYLSRPQRRAQLFQRSRANQTGLHLKKQKTINYIAYRKKVQRGRRLLKSAARSVFKDRTEDQSLAAIKKDGCSAFQGINGETISGTVINPDTQSGNSHAANGDQRVINLPIKKESPLPNWQDKRRNILIVLNGNKKTPSQATKCDRILDPRRETRSTFFQCRKKRFPLFMMYKKFSMITFRYRILKSQFRARNKTLKLRKFNRSRVQKVIRGLGQNLSTRGAGGVCNLLTCLTSKKNPVVQRLHSSSDMNSNISRLFSDPKECIPDGYPGTESVKLRCSQRQCEETVPKRHDCQNGQHMQNTTSEWECAESVATELDVAPVVNNCLDDIFVLVTDKEDSVSCGDENMVESNKRDSGTNYHVSGGEPLLKEYMGIADNSCQMEVDESTDSDAFSTKFDHLYCKRPHEDPSSEDASVTSEKQEGEMQLEAQEGEVHSEKQEGGVKNSQKITSLVPDQDLTSHICGFLNETMKKYGSLIPLSERDVLARLKEVFNEDFSCRKSFITKEIMKFRAKHSKGVVCNFRVFYNKHMLDMDDLATLDGQNWLNDQVINMYGELIMDAVRDKVHFFNSFFHRQLVTKGYNGVKRWTKKVDLFKKTLLLIPIHLEVHWSLITVNLPNRIISFYDSQGIHFKFCVENIRKYLLTEAREKNNPEFLQGWQTAAVTKYIPQQKNDSDCGVFVLQYCKCLALDQPFQFSQDDMPRVRKRIYKELCECRLMD